MPDLEPRYQRRRRTALFVVAGLTVVFGGGLVVSRWLPDPQRDLERALLSPEDDPQTSEQVLRQWMTAHPDQTAEPRAALALLSLARGDGDEAEKQLAGLDLSAVPPDLLLRIGERAAEGQRWRMAAQALEPLLKRDGEHATEARRLLWRVYRQLSQEEEAIPVARDLLRDEPDNLDLRVELCWVLKNAFREAECLEEVRRTLERDPPLEIRRPLELLQIDQLTVLGEVPEAWKVLEAIEARDGRSTALLLKTVDLYRAEGRLEEALKLVNTLLPQFPHLPAAYLTRGTILIDLNRCQEALPDLERVVSAEPFNERAQFKLSEAYRRTGHDGAARTHRDRGLALRNMQVRRNELLKQASTGALGPAESDELDTLTRNLGLDRGRQP